MPQICTACDNPKLAFATKSHYEDWRKDAMTVANRAIWLGRKCMNMKRKIESIEPPTVPRIDAATLLAAGREIILVHKETEYRLRLTSNDKLILTK